MTKEEARLTLQDNFGYLSQEHPRILEALRVALDALSHPSAPSNLDEAAHCYAWEKQENHIDFDGDEYLDYGPRYDAFKAGAEWMAGQGEIIEGDVITTSTNGWECIRINKKLHSVDDKVTIQIRKK